MTKLPGSISVFFWALAIGMIVVSPRATAGLVSACPLTPGGSCIPPDDMGDAPGTMLAVKFAPFSFTTRAGITHGVLKAEVFAEMGGTLDFYYIVFNQPDSATAVARESDLNFTGWATSVAFRSDGSQVPDFVDGNVPPSSADRDGSGSTVGFNFGPILPNQRSRVVVISTNAFSFTTGQSMVDGSGPLTTFQPTVPEPATFILLGGGLLLMTLFRGRSRNIDGRNYSMTKLLVALVAMTFAFTHSAALADDGVPVEGILAVNFTSSPTSPGIIAISANGIGNLTNVGNLSFQLQKTLDTTGKVPLFSGTFTITAVNGDTLTGTYAAVGAAPDAGGFGTFSGQITVTGGTGRFQSASGIVPFSAIANGGLGQAAYSFKGFLRM
jgi:PEP-CTERM motif